MPRTILTINPTTDGTGTHDPSAAIFQDNELVFGVEEERFIRRKHAEKTFPKRSIQACLDACSLELADLDKIVVSWDPKEKAKYDLRLALAQPSLPKKAYQFVQSLKDFRVCLSKLENNLAELGTPVPPIELRNHHLCHAASAFYPSGFDEALIVTVDGRGERDATVVWRADGDGLTRVRTYEFPNSLGGFYGTVTEYLGYRMNNGEGKIMGLAPYGNRNPDIEDNLRELIETGVDYDVSALNYHTGQGIRRLENQFERPRKEKGGEFDQWEKDFAFVAQQMLEETVLDIVETYCRDKGVSNVGLAGGVALNAKMNKRIMESEFVDEIFIQPVSNDAGGAIGAGLLDGPNPGSVEMDSVYWGPEYTSEIEETLRECKLDYTKPERLEQSIAKRLANGELVGWFQGRMEMGPRALGNRTILADSRTVESRDRVNEFVKHREEWRPFAPSMLEEAADDYLVNAEPAPYMIKTFDVREEKRDVIPAVLHEGDYTTRPQTVRKDQNPRYYRLIREFEDITGVPVVLNTSFNDHGEPIVNRPVEAIKDFFGMGLDVLVLADLVVEKNS